MTPSRSLLLGPLLAAACAALLTGCEPDRQTISADDVALYPMGRAVFRVPDEMDKLPATERETTTGSPVQSLVGGELEFSYARGETDAEIGAGPPAELRHQLIPAPARIDLRYELFDSSAAFRGGMRLWGVLELEGIAGLGFRQLNLDARSGAIRDSDDSFSAGPLIGGRLGVRPLGRLAHGRWLGLYGRAVYSFHFAERAKGEESTSYELGAELGPFFHLGFFAGWRWWALDRDQEHDDSQVSLDIDGPVVGLLIAF